MEAQKMFFFSEPVAVIDRGQIFETYVCSI